MDFVPAVVTIGNVGTGHADTVSDMRNRYLRMEIPARTFVRVVGWCVLADHFYHEPAMRVRHIDQIQDRFVVGIKCDMQIAIRRAKQRGHTPLGSSTTLKDAEALPLLD